MENPTREAWRLMHGQLVCAAVLLVAALTSNAFARLPAELLNDPEWQFLEQPSQFSPDALRMTSAPRAKAAKAVTNMLRNPGFEDTLPGGALAEWTVFREAFVDVDPVSYTHLTLPTILRV